MFLELSDLLEPGATFVSQNGQGGLDFADADPSGNPFELINGWAGGLLGIVTADNEICNAEDIDGIISNNCGSTVGGPAGFNALLASLGIDPGLVLGGDGVDFVVQTTSNGSFRKNAIPEPAGLALLGIGLLGLGAAKRKKA